MPSGSCGKLSELPKRQREILERGRRGFFATVDPRAQPHVVPIVYAVRDEEVISAIDHKPKSGRVMARVRNIRVNPRAALVIDDWDEEWTKVGWVMIQGRAYLEAPENESALRERYPQYQEAEPFDALIVIVPEKILWWTWE